SERVGASTDSRAIIASPSTALSVTLSAGFCPTASLPGCMLVPLPAPGGLGQLPLALSLARRRQPLRCRRRWRGRRRPELLCDRGGDPNEGGELLTVFGTASVRLDTIKQRPGLVGAELNFLEASEQLEALKHGVLHGRRDEIFGCSFGCPM